MKSVVALLCCVLVAQATLLDLNLRERWEEFKQTHKKNYGETEHEFRFKIFADNLRKIHQHNKAYREGKSTYWMAINKYSDLLPSEFADTLLMKPRKVDLPETVVTSDVNEDLPASFDWRPKGAVTPVKDQGSCGSCWAFSTTGTIEGMNFIKNGELVSLSEQNLMDCSWDYNNHGCGGGEEREGLHYVVDNGGIDTEEGYPYEEKDSHKCRYDESKVGAKITGYETLKKGDEEDLKRAVATAGPVSIAVDVTSSFQSYGGGVYYEEDCNPNYLNHAILAVGYGTDEETGKDYWIVKNSWGESYGEDGYIRMARNADNNCGVASECYYPLM